MPIQIIVKLLLGKLLQHLVQDVSGADFLAWFFYLVVLHVDIGSFAEAFPVLSRDGGTSFEKPCTKGKYFGQKRPPPPRGNKFILTKNREEIQLKAKKKNPKTSLFLHIMPYSSLFFAIFGSFDHIMRKKCQNFGASRQLWSFG